MARRKKATSARAEKQTPAPASKESAAAGRKPGLRKWVFRVAALLLSPLLFFAVLECILRIAGFGYPTTFLLHRTVQGKDVLIENRKFGWRFFGRELARTPYPLMLPAKKPSDTIRIFVFGESAAYGDPQPDFGLPRMLKVLLQERYPGTHFEVINAAMVAINSNVILPIARECARQDGDIWVIYMGNNEVVGPYGSGTVFGRQTPGLSVIRASLAVKSTRTGELLNNLIERLGGGGRLPTEWTGTLMFVRNHVRADDPRMKRVYSHFASNLEDILRIGQDHGVKIVVSTVVSNLKDCAPFASDHPADFKPDQLKQWEQLYHAGMEAEKSGNTTNALKFYEKAAHVDDHFAELQFRWARCCLALGREKDAKQHYILARDYDTLRFRCDTRLNAEIRQLVSNREKEGIIFCDSEEALARQSSGGLVGNEWLYEHVHLNFEGTYLLTRNLAEEVNRLLPEAVKNAPTRRSQWLSQRECADTLVWTDWNLLQTLQTLDLDVPPFTYQLDAARRSRHLQHQRDELVARLGSSALNQIAEKYQRAIAITPDDWVLRKNLALLQQETGDLSAAADSWRQVAEILPDETEAYLQRGVLLSVAGRTDEATSQFETAFNLDPDSAETVFVKVLGRLGKDLLAQGKFKAAVGLYRQSLQFRPLLAEAHIDLGNALIELGETNEAQEHFRIALQRPPGTPQGLIALGKVCISQGWTNEATKSFEAALQLDPANAAAHLNLGIVLLEQNQKDSALRHFEEALRVDPGNAEIQQWLERIRKASAWPHR